MQMKFNNSEVQMGFNAYFENFNFHFLLILRMVEFHLKVVIPRTVCREKNKDFSTPRSQE
eukprot:UN23769